MVSTLEACELQILEVNNASVHKFSPILA